jgi:integrase
MELKQWTVPVRRQVSSSAVSRAKAFLGPGPIRAGREVRIILKLLGHASVEITYNRYIHFFEGDIDDTLRQAVGE